MVTLSATAQAISELIVKEHSLDHEMAELAEKLLILQTHKEGIIAMRKRLAQEVAK